MNERIKAIYIAVLKRNCSIDLHEYGVNVYLVRIFDQPNRNGDKFNRLNIVIGPKSSVILHHLIDASILMDEIDE